MLNTYRIIPVVFILFLFGFTLFTVAPVIAEDSPEFVACQQIKPSGDFQLLHEKKNCFRDVARALQDQSGNSIPQVPPADQSGGEVAQLNAKIAEMADELDSLRPKYEELQAKYSYSQNALERNIASYESKKQAHNELMTVHKDVTEQLAIALGKNEAADAHMEDLRTSFRQHNCSQASHKIHSANPALSRFGNGFMRIIGAPMHCDGYWRD
jgi:chromosome segregation ATPase